MPYNARMRMVPLFSREQIADGVQRVAQEIRRSLGDEEPVVALCLLNGALWFAADLLRLLPPNFELHTIRLSSYEGTSSTGQLQWHSSLPPCRGRRVLVIDDVLDTGLTLREVCSALRAAGAASVHTAVAITKDGCSTTGIAADFCALHCGARFLVGYGLDFNGRFRNLSHIACMEQAAPAPQELKKLDVVAALILDTRGRVLATQCPPQKHGGGWEFPGGKVEPGETFAAALVREISEELALDIEPGELLCTVQRDSATVRVHLHCFLCRIRGGVLTLREHAAARWLEAHELESVDWLPADREVLPRLAPHLLRLASTAPQQ